MGFAKRELERQWACDDVATMLAVTTRVNVRCEVCEDVTANFGDIESAYRFGNALMSANDPRVACFSSRREMTDTVRRVVDETPMDCHCSIQAAKGD